MELAMTPIMMRQFWALIEATQANTLLQFDDSDLVQLLTKQFAAKAAIDDTAATTLNSYIRNKLPLIRDSAEYRQSTQEGI